MAFATCDFRLLPIPVRHLNRFMKVAGGEGVRMKQSIHGLTLQLGGNVCRVRVAIIALSMGVMGRIEPCIVVLLHHMAVGAGTGVVAEIGRPFRVVERECSGTKCTANCDAHGDKCWPGNATPWSRRS